jgi:cysteine desulfurase
LARAFGILDARVEQDVRENRQKRSAFLAALPPALGGRVNGSATHFAPANVSLTIPGIAAARVMSELDHLLISAGAACSSAASGPSHVLKAIGLSDSRLNAPYG